MSEQEEPSRPVAEAAYRTLGESVYFGCWGQKGHYFWEPNGSTLWRYSEAKKQLPWPEIDGALTHKGCRQQGAAVLHHAQDWTALAWHDFTVDTRGGSNSVLFHRGTLTYEQMVLHLSLVWTPIFLRQERSLFLVAGNAEQLAGEQRG